MNLQDDENTISNKEFQKSVEEKRIHNLEKVFQTKNEPVHFKVENNSYHFVIL